MARPSPPLTPAGRWAAIGEAFAVFTLVMSYIWRLRYTLPVAWVALLALVLLSHALRRETPASLGFRRENFTGCLKVVARAVAPVCLLLILAGFRLGTILAPSSPSDAALGVLVYCGWGLFQQYLLHGYFVRRLRAATGVPSPCPAALAAGGIFSLAHFPNPFLMLVTAAGGYLSARVYLRYGNLYPLGIAHGVIGYAILHTLPDSITGHFYIGPGWVLRFG